MTLSPTSRRRKNRVMLAGVTLMAAALVAWAGGRPDMMAALVNPVGKTDTPRTFVLQQGPMDRLISATAYFQARDQVDVGAQISGQLKSVEVLPGDRVKKGQLLAVIDDALARSRLAQTRATLESVRAQRAAKEAQIALARQQLERNTRLVERGVAPTANFQTSEATLATLIAESDALQAQARGIEAAIAQSETELTFARIVAPMDGTVTAVVARQGQTLNATQQAPTILRIADLASLYLVAQVSEADVLSVKPGMTAYFTLLGAEGRRWSGTVVRVLPSPVTQNNVVLYEVSIEVANPEDLFKLQMTAQVSLIVDRRECLIKLPRGALPRGFRAPGPLELQIFAADGPPRTVHVPIAIMDDREAGIDCAEAERSGLKTDARVAPAASSSKAKSAKAPQS